MSVSDQTPLNSYTGNGVTTVFAFSFLLLASGDLEVQVGGVTKALGADYTVAGLGVTAGGTVTFLAAPAVSASVVIFRDSVVQRATDYQNNGDFLAAVVNLDFDRLWLVMQEMLNGSKGSPTALRVPNGETVSALPAAAARASKLVGFDASGAVALVTPSSQDAAALALSLASAGASTGAAQVAYLPGGTGAVATTVQAFLRKRVTVEGLGADPTGVASSNTAFDSAAAEVVAQGGGDLFVGPGTFKLLNWVLPAGVRLTGAGRGRTLLQKNAGGVGTHVIRAAGSFGTTQALTGNVAAGAVSVPVATSAAFAVNAWALVREATYVSGAAGRKQQIVRVTATTGTSVSFAMPLLEAYTTAASAEVLPLTGVTDAGIFAVSIEGINSTSGGGCVQIQHGIGFQIEDVHTRWNSDQSALKFQTCYDSHMHNVSARDGLNQSVAGYGYGIEFDESVMMSSVTGAYTENMRENLFTNRTALCRFAESRMVGNYDSGVNTHGAFVRHCTLEDNEIIGVQVGLGVGVGFGTHGAGDTDIVVRRNKIMYAGSVGISVNAPVGKENLRIELDGNTVFQNATGGANSGILIQYANTVRSRDNVVDGNNSTNVNAGIYVLNCSDTTFDDEGIRNLANGYGFRYESCTDLSANNVSAFNISSDNFRGTGTNVRVFINGKRVDDANETIGTGAAHTGRLQSGRAALAFAAVSTVTLAVTFPAAYPAGIVPVVNATAENSLGVWRGALISTPTNTGFSVTLTDDGATNRTGTAYVNWTALG